MQTVSGTLCWMSKTIFGARQFGGSERKKRLPGLLLALRMAILPSARSLISWGAKHLEWRLR
jgi:hypothetical protein